MGDCTADAAYPSVGLRFAPQTFLLNHTDKDDRTALHIAGFKCDEDVVQERMSGQ